MAVHPATKSSVAFYDTLPGEGEGMQLVACPTHCYRRCFDL